MSLLRNRKKYLNKKSLSRPNQQATFLTNDNETPLCTCRKASYTLEAVVVFPLMAVFLVFLLFFFRIMQVETKVQSALIYAGRSAAVISSVTSSDTAALAAAKGIFEKEVADDLYVRKYVQGKSMGIVLTESKVSDTYIDLRATYRVKYPIRIFGSKSLTLIAESKNRRWNGKKEGNEKADDDRFVYCTPNGTVYHLKKDCAYLDLSIHSTVYSNIASTRNKNGHKYSACSRCVDKNKTNSVVYITDYGTCYHCALSCAGLKRTVYKVKRTEISDKKACSKCGFKDR